MILSTSAVEGDKDVTQNPQVFRRNARVLASGHTWSRHVTLKGSLTPLPYEKPCLARGPRMAITPLSLSQRGAPVKMTTEQGALPPFKSDLLLEYSIS